jgi:CheY-like chemotaxis protein
VNENDSRLSVLLVENVVSKTKLIHDALERSNNKCRLHAVGVGKNTISYLRKDGPFASAPTPDLVLFDMSDAQKHDLGILDRVQRDTTARNIPMVILTSPVSEQMFEDAYDGDADCVLFSPIELDRFLHTMHSRTPDRFLSAVSLIQKVGFVMVRVPGEFMETNTGESVVGRH